MIKQTRPYFRPMARRNKLWRFAQLQTYTNYFEPATLHQPEVVGASGETLDMRGEWARKHFQNGHRITLELACGRGEYTVALARANPDRNFIGVDIKGARIYQGATIARDEQIHNAAFLRTRIEQLDHLFAIGEIAEIWITFPDPFPSSVNRRLISPQFWTAYARLLEAGGHVHLKTDDDGLYEYAQEISPSLTHFRCVANHEDIYAEPSLPHPELSHKTYYECKHLERGLKIKWISWERLDKLPPSPFRHGAEDPLG